MCRVGKIYWGSGDRPLGTSYELEQVGALAQSWGQHPPSDLRTGFWGTSFGTLFMECDCLCSMGPSLVSRSGSF